MYHEEVILTRSPLRISIAGGGTDLPSYYLGRGSSWISGAINHYCYTAANYGFAEEYLIKYANSERVKDVSEIKHNLIRETLLFSKQDSPLELTFSADLPGGTGLGSSSAFTVSLLGALHTYNKRHFSAAQLAEEATQIERDLLKEPIGLQDQYISALGGITKFSVDDVGNLSWQQIPVSTNWYNRFEEKIFLIYTGKTRLANEFLSKQVEKTMANDSELIRQLDWVKESVSQIYDFLINSDFSSYGSFLDEYWAKKRKRDIGMTSTGIDDIYSNAIKNGAIGGKLIGAGGSGFLMFITSDKEKLRASVDPLGTREVPFSFDHQGFSVLAQN
jgi:D-glycero-alpha-D-manno-heptose-7-phosphate kinase